MCIQTIWSPEARDSWIVQPNDYTPTETMLDEPSDENLEWLIEEILRYVREPHPNSRQAAAIWLLALLKNCSGRKPLQDRLKIFQGAFLDLLGENNGNLNRR